MFQGISGCRVGYTSSLNEFRCQLLLTFQENGIHSMAQVDAGMRISCRQERPSLPSPGQIVAWCNQR
ncbi:hypothetical protein GQS73_04545 [Enterobacter ludwigii]|nr:hypothetical protein [Enterobacter ludwigii]MED7683253.1 hypothetical protein [Enterobacter ludwigii]